MEKKKEKAKKEVKAKGTQKSPALSNPKNNEELKFGGLPDRDLKKNLGCG